ncbi:MAG TPA: ATP-binding protein, partial [Synergistaceae bacterium]|nr:ATP-binding protein [Synergistaceae bacterium]
LADEEGIAQILLNLLTNAEKYSDTRREIEVVLGEDELSLWVDVMDRGVGIDSGDRERIFREFYRGDDSLTARAQGAGLGLSISRNIARDHRGDLFVLPREGGGSVFRLLLPRTSEKSVSREEEIT